MRWVGWHAQLMDSFPRSNAHIGRIQVGALFGELQASLFGALILFVSEALGGRLYQVECTGRRHVSLDPKFK